jgi:hypothetical protein
MELHYLFQYHAPRGGRLPDERINVLIAAAVEKSLVHSVHSLPSTTKVWPRTF